MAIRWAAAEAPSAWRGPVGWPVDLCTAAPPGRQHTRPQARRRRRGFCFSLFFWPHAQSRPPLAGRDGGSEVRGRKGTEDKIKRLVVAVEAVVLWEGGPEGRLSTNPQPLALTQNSTRRPLTEFRLAQRRAAVFSGMPTAWQVDVCGRLRPRARDSRLDRTQLTVPRSASKAWKNPWLG